MDHLVLIPQEFNLVVTSEKVPQDSVTVWSNARISQGTLFYPFQGTVRIDKLNVFSTVSEDDVSTETMGTKLCKLGEDKKEQLLWKQINMIERKSSL